MPSQRRARASRKEKEAKAPVVEISDGDVHGIADAVIAGAHAAIDEMRTTELRDGWWKDEALAPEKGAHAVKALDQIWEPVACGPHSRRVEREDGGAHRDGEGFDASCTDCQAQWAETLDHIHQVRKDRT